MLSAFGSTVVVSPAVVVVFAPVVVVASLVVVASVVVAAVTVTVTVVDLPSLLVTVMVVLPSFTPVIVPSLETEAMLSSSDLKSQPV